MKLDRCPVSQEEKQRMIATAAYFRSVQKGFADTDPLEDWLTAEAEIASALRAQCDRRQLFARGSANRRAGLLDAVSRWLYRATAGRGADRDRQ